MSSRVNVFRPVSTEAISVRNGISQSDGGTCVYYYTYEKQMDYLLLVILDKQRQARMRGLKYK